MKIELNVLIETATHVVFLVKEYLHRDDFSFSHKGVILKVDNVVCAPMWGGSALMLPRVYTNDVQRPITVDWQTFALIKEAVVAYNKRFVVKRVCQSCRISCGNSFTQLSRFVLPPDDGNTSVFSIQRPLGTPIVVEEKFGEGFTLFALHEGMLFPSREDAQKFIRLFEIE